MASSTEPPSPSRPAMDHSHYDYRIMQPPPDFAAHMQMPHIPLPLETPLPPSSYDFTSHGAFPIPQSMHGPQAHPLFEGVLAMHQMLGHDLNLAWPDVAQCNQQSSMSYSDDSNSPYACPPQSIDQLQQWTTPPSSIMDPTPSPLEESLPHTPEQTIELIPEPIGQHKELSPPPPPHAQNTGFAMFPLVVTGAKTHEHTIAFQADRQKSEKAGSKLDPFAADFIREKLGEHRWNIFSSRLAERRTTSQKSKSRMDANGSATDSFVVNKGESATVIDFLVKVEVVKSVLRTFVPHPYNPLKTLSHAYDAAPSGQVTLSRTTVLTLSGWSNTQFSYWARRAEAISVLGMYDERLRTVALALQYRLQSQGLLEGVDASAPSSSQRSHHPRINFDAASREDLDPEEWVRTYVTGKGLDVIIDEVKKQTGVSPFLRGKHSSLDPFGTVSIDADADGGGRKAIVYMPTFQAEKYVHEVPADIDPSALSGMIGSKKAGKRKASSPLRTESEGEDAWPSIGGDLSGEDAMSVKTSSSRMQSASPPLFAAMQDLPGSQFASAGFELPVSDSRYSFDGSGPQRSAPPHSHPSPYARPSAKKRRLAPAPPDSMARNVVSEPLRIYHNHLRTG
ncbi:uncharacterized protein PHACADRAFT_256342 [Phanerochaete carnosa HHB-10118-sp]|uniref:Uncharacterized protein n=1 Tax=Phanerochaete carnosa (strain HHB-10118-sp) TaxID=650164 RepID=K5W9F7_PHACS|nr:uncharacterized protein PHACADRAFT_256342 [Phanerochaete carnosa HHB-10118-sp]EKM55609.1 hypothetical protein PHACADRAFT_256342 [Phanerochaete carnosa HHB-10118-sp]